MPRRRPRRARARPRPRAAGPPDAPPPTPSGRRASRSRPSAPRELDRPVAHPEERAAVPTAACAAPLDAVEHGAPARLEALALRLRVDALPLPLLVSVGAEVHIGVELGADLLHHELDHDRVVEEADSRYLVGDQVDRLGEVREGVDHARAVLPLDPPLGVVEHADHHLEAAEALADEVRELALGSLGYEASGRVDDRLLVELARARLHLAHRLAEVREVGVGELERDLDRHASPPGRRRAYRKPSTGAIPPGIAPARRIGWSACRASALRPAGRRTCRAARSPSRRPSPPASPRPARPPP